MNMQNPELIRLTIWYGYTVARPVIESGSKGMGMLRWIVIGKKRYLRKLPVKKREFGRERGPVATPLGQQKSNSAGDKKKVVASSISLVSDSVSKVTGTVDAGDNANALHCAYFWPSDTLGDGPGGGLPRFPADSGNGAPSTDILLSRPSVSESFSQLMPNMVEIYNAVKSKGMPNYRGAKIQLDSALNVQLWEDIAHIHGDYMLSEMMRYGFPSGHVGQITPAAELKNHASALRNPTSVKAYLDKEISLGALVGPFDRAPFEPWTRSNPMLTRPKRDSKELRVILDLSFPNDCSVNGGIPRESLDGSNFKLRLPSPLDLARKIVALGSGCKIYKIDLSRAYRQLKGNPLDLPMMGVMWGDQFYIDLAVPFGLRHGASACQRTSEAAAAVAQERVGSDTESYVDDTAGAARAFGCR